MLPLLSLLTLLSVLPLSRTLPLLLLRLTGVPVLMNALLTFSHPPAPCFS